MVDPNTPWFKVSSEQRINSVSETFNNAKGDRIDKVLFMRDILNYLDEDIDNMNLKYQGRIGVKTRQQN